jgi:signal transduction histidine kinase
VLEPRAGVDVLLASSRYRWWLLRAALVYRAVGGAVGILALIVSHGLTPELEFLLLLWLGMLLATVVAYDALREHHITRRRTLGILLAVDTAAAVALNLAGALLVPGSVLDGFGVVFWFYAQSTVVMWWLTSRRARWTVLVVGAVLAWALVRLDPDRPVPLPPLDEAGFVAVHVLWLVLGVVTLAVSHRLLRLGSTVALVEGVAVGSRTTQDRMLREVHDTVLQTLEAIALHASTPDVHSCPELRAVRDVARHQAADLRAVLEGPSTDTDLWSELARLCDRFTPELTVTLDVPPSVRALHFSPGVVTVLVGAVRECLTNVAKHAGTRRASVTVDVTKRSTRVIVRDQGCGFAEWAVPGFGLAHSVHRRLAEAGGSATVESVPGHGTMVTLAIPVIPDRGASVSVRLPGARPGVAG